jgi:hypothetical protein
MSSATDLDQKELMTKGVSFIAAAVATPEISRLEERINSLVVMVNYLQLQIEEIKTKLDKAKIVPTREVFLLPPDEIKKSVASYLREKGEAYPSDIADSLGISINEVLAVISVLKKERKVAEV